MNERLQQFIGLATRDRPRALLLVQAPALRNTLVDGAAAVMALSRELFLTGRRSGRVGGSSHEPPALISSVHAANQRDQPRSSSRAEGSELEPGHS
jgi:hypothetical protein